MSLYRYIVDHNSLGSLSSTHCARNSMGARCHTMGG